MTNDDMELVREYATRHSEEAFAELVRRHVNLVYSVALRQLRDPQAAEETAQTVFVLLARKAGSLGSKTVLSAWLCRSAQYVAADALRTQRRRKNREQEAYMQSLSNQPEPEPSVWTNIAPLLDIAMAGLGEKDHSAVVLRFFEGKDLKQVAAALGTNENAAKTRLSRAVDKLRKFFAKRGLVMPATVIAGAICAHSVQAAPSALARSVTAVALSKGAASTATLTLVKGALKIMAWTKTQTAAVGILVVALATYSVLQHQAQVKLREQNTALLQEIGRLSALKTENENLSNLLARANTSEAGERARLNDLLRQREHSFHSSNAQAAIVPPVQPDSTPAGATIKLPKESWTNAGFATPEATLKTRGWAVLNGDRKSFAQSVYLTDGARKMIEDQLVQIASNSKDPNAPRLIQEALAENWGAEEAILMPMVAENQNNTYTGFEILSEQSPSINSMNLDVQTDMAAAPSKTESLKFQCFGNDWKIVIDEAAVQNEMTH